MENSLYRFRSVENLLSAKYKELEDQNIYFAHPEQLNDPMEEFRDIVWSGDGIAWKNLFKHYLLCLEHVRALFAVSGEDYYQIEGKDIPVFKGYDDLPTTEYKQLFDKISLEFIEECTCLIDYMASANIPVRIHGLRSLLSIIHYTAINIIETNYLKAGHIKERILPIAKNKITELIDLLKKLPKTVSDSECLDKILSVFDTIATDIKLLAQYQHNNQNKRTNMQFIYIDFIDEYINRLEDLIYPNWYTACFMRDCSNSAVWGHYGDDHKGVCLIFRGTLLGGKGFQFYKVRYDESYPKIDFFKSIGQLPVLKLFSTWYMDEHGNRSNVAQNISNNEDEWRKEYWQRFTNTISVKTKDWKYEKEHRLVLVDMLASHTKSEDRIFQYDFMDLNGIIFGMKTSTEDKLKIFKIIEKKCNEYKRDKFEFYHAFYSSKHKNIQHRKITFKTCKDLIQI